MGSHNGIARKAGSLASKAFAVVNVSEFWKVARPVAARAIFLEVVECVLVSCPQNSVKNFVVK